MPLDTSAAVAGASTTLQGMFSGLYHGQPGAKAFRRYLSENAVGPDVSVEVLRHARDAMRARQQRPMAAAE